MAELDYQYIAGLVDQAKAGDSDAFAELYTATYQKQYMFSYNYIKDEYLAQDALQETFVLALKYLNTLQDSRLFISWLNQINFRVCYNIQRRKKITDAELNNQTEAIYEVPSSMDTPEDEVVSIDSQEYLIKQIMALPFSESQAIILYYYRKKRIDEIAYMMEISRSSVKRYLKSGRTRLAKYFEF